MADSHAAEFSDLLKEDRSFAPPSSFRAHAHIADERLDPACEEVLAICRELFETRLGPDDGFTEAGGHWGASVLFG